LTILKKISQLPLNVCANKQRLIIQRGVANVSKDMKKIIERKIMSRRFIKGLK
jgi:hypothetical protein